ncbi:MAG: hypothetical protein CMN29_07405 [Sandaracinus sp.]|nr:hypothetical protein [Sandaracinus sp.]
MGRNDAMKRMKSTTTRARATLAALLALGLGACSDAGTAERGGSPGARLAPGGAQDFGLFRQIVEEGGIPASSTLDATGFFAEHAIGAPEASCDDAVCANASLGLMGNLINGNACTLVRVALSTTREAVTDRPVHLVVVADTSSRAQAEADALLRPALGALAEQLREGDRMSVVAFADTPTVLAEEASDSGTILAAHDAHAYGGQRDLYGALRAGYALAEERAREGEEARVLLLSTGGADLGITSPARLVELVQAQAGRGIATSVVGFGDDADETLWGRLSATGAGNSFFVADAADAREVFREELATSFTPLATDVSIRLDGGNGYHVVGLYGVSDADFEPASGTARVPSLFLAGRRDGGDVGEGPGMGRRGGGGAILFELMPRLPRPAGADPFLVGDVTVSYTDPLTGEAVEQRAAVRAETEPGEMPPGGLFADPYIEKAFVTLNVLVGFKSMTLAAEEGDWAAGLAVGEGLAESLRGWLETTPDTDIEDDLALLERLLDTMQSRAGAGQDRQATPTPVWAFD